MFRDELHLISINPWADHWLDRPVYRGDVARRGNVVPTLQELAILPARQAAEEASGWLSGKPAPHVVQRIREAIAAHPGAAALELRAVLMKIN